MSWQSVSDIVQRMMVHRDAIPADGDIRTRAAHLVVASFGVEAAIAQPALVNIAALALSMDRLVVHRLTADAAEQVRATELRAVPGQPPGLMRRPFIVESRRPERHPLFGQTAALAGYELDGRLFLIGLDYPDGIRVEPVRIHWQEQDIEPTTTDSPLIEGDIHEHRLWAQYAAEWVVTLGALLEAEGAPLEAEDWSEASASKRQRPGRRQKATDGWLVRRVALTRAAAQRVSSRANAETSAARRDGLVLGETWVRGHLRRQPYGPGRELRKWVYIEGYEARRWMSRRPLRIDVDTD